MNQMSMYSQPDYSSIDEDDSFMGRICGYSKRNVKADSFRSWEDCEDDADDYVERSYRTAIPTVFSKLSPQEEFSLFSRLQTGDDAAYRTILNRHLPLLRMIAAKFLDRGFSLDDLTNVAYFALVRAIWTFSLDQTAHFNTLATTCIRRELLSFTSQNGTIRISNSGAELRRKVLKYIADYQRQYETECLPTVAEIADELNEKEDAVFAIMQSLQKVDSLDMPTSDDDDAEPLSAFVAGGNATEEMMNKEDFYSTLLPLLGKYKERDVNILSSSFGLQDRSELPTEKIAEKYGITTARVLQIKAAILADLKSHLELMQCAPVA